jgi:hypothetical protein
MQLTRAGQRASVLETSTPPLKVQSLYRTFAGRVAYNLGFSRPAAFRKIVADGRVNGSTLEHFSEPGCAQYR